MSEKQKKNLIIIGVILVILLFAGFYYKKSRISNDENNTNDEIDEINQSPDALTPADSDSTEKSQIKLAYDEYLQQGIGYETKGDLINAIDSYKKASELSPENYVPYSNIGSAYLSMKKYADAETALLKALELDPTSVSVYVKLYDVYFIGMRRVTLVGFFKNAIEKTNGNISLIKLYASYLEDVADFE
ncbi:MAG: tetratricopeptide repeat protein, partial [Patescibacteria group bacterium]